MPSSSRNDTSSSCAIGGATIAFIGGGNMASAIIGGLRRQGQPASQIIAVDPHPETRARLHSEFGITTLAEAGAALAHAALAVWAVKPQVFKPAAQAAAPFVREALHLSVAAGIRSDSIAHWLGSERVVRCMPNTPALIGQGMTGLFARAGVSAADRAAAERVIATTGEALWVDAEQRLDAVTALSGSGPAYVFFFLEAMAEAGLAMGLAREQAHRLAVGTFTGAAALARTSSEPPETLRARVTSKGGTTYAAITALEQAGVKAAFTRAIRAAEQRARELGDEFGAG